MKYRIKEVLSQKGMTSGELAKRIGLTANALSNIITGRSQPSMDRLEKMAEVLEVSVPELMVIPDRYDVSFCCPNCQRPLKIRVEIDENH